jgi:WD40 repeat protein
VWEYEDALKAKRPVWVYQRSEKPKGDYDDPEWEAKAAQYAAVKKFAATFRNADGSLKAGINSYSTPQEFSTMLHAHLEQWVRRALEQPGESRPDLGVPKLPSDQKRFAMLAPEPPGDFVARPLEFDTLKKQLLDRGSDGLAITAALNGAGGYGKTTLAKALAHDPDIQDAYSDGILWIELGEKSANLLSILSDLVEVLSGERPGLENLNIAAAKLGEALRDRRILMIVDDVWRERDLRPFLQGGPNTARLITTRIDNVLPVNATRQQIDRMQDDEAAKLVAAGLPPHQVTAQRTQIGKLAARLGKWALLLKLVNSFLRDRVVRNGQSLASAIADVNKRLDEKSLIAFDARKEADRTTAAARAIGISLELLDPSASARFGELGVFPEDADVPISIVARMWAETGHLDETDTEDLLSELHGLSLLLSLDFNQRTLRLHDTIRHLLRYAAGREGLVLQNKRLLHSLDGIPAASDVDSLTLRYFYLNQPYHLAEATERERLDALLLNPGWLEAKLAATGNPQALVADYLQHGVGEIQTLIGWTLRLTTGICVRDKRQLIPQLLGRLIASEIATDFLNAARAHLKPPAILEQRSSLTPPGAEIARLEGHLHSARALCMLSDGRLASGGDENTIRLWNLATGVETGSLVGKFSSVNALCALPDGRLASATDGDSIQLWDLVTSASTFLEGHSGSVRALCVLPDGRLASGAQDKTIRLWDPATATETACFRGHLHWIRALCALPDGRLVSGSNDSTIRLWDPVTASEVDCFKGHSDTVHTLCVLRDGRLVSASQDNTIRLWNLENGTESARLEKDFDCTLCVLRDGRLAVAADDNTIRLWDPVPAAEPGTRVVGHAFSINALCVLPDGRLASASDDKTIRLWDPAREAATARLEGHSHSVNALCLLPDGRVASGSADKTIQLWDPVAGARMECLKGYSYSINALCALSDGRLAAGSDHKTVFVWNPITGAATPLKGHFLSVRTLLVLPDGRLASGSDDQTIRIWDIATGAETGCLRGHTNWVRSLCVLPDGRLASASDDKTVRLWNTATGAETARLEGHSGSVYALCVLPDGRLASGSDDKTIRLWDLTIGAKSVRLARIIHDSTSFSSPRRARAPSTSPDLQRLPVDLNQDGFRRAG